VILCDFLVIGGGIIGINVARELKRRYADASILIIEKEAECGYHASSRNSGVLHAGFYYTSDSLKARFCRNGNLLLTEYCEEKKLPINKCGKLVVARGEDEVPILEELFQRGTKNGVKLELLTAEEAEEIEPHVKTYEKCLFSPSTSSVNPLLVTLAMKADAIQDGIECHTGVRYIERSNGNIKTSSGVISPGYIINSAGLYADKIANDFGFSNNYRILPFKGLYLYSNGPIGKVGTNIYPVPDLRNPFLGVHITVPVDGRPKIGPTAIPALWREHYKGLDNFKLKEFIDVLAREIGLFCRSDFDFKRLALKELHKYSKTKMMHLASELLRNVGAEDNLHWGKPGIRAQLVNLETHKLEMDFVCEADDRSFHILNAVSPGFTCSIPFSQYVCDQIQSHLN